MFEINSNPKSITIQKKSGSGDWLTISKMQSHRRHFSFIEVKNMLRAYSATYDNQCAIRVANEYGKTILSSYSLLFLETVFDYKLITVKYLDENDNQNLNIFCKANNPNMKNIREFQRYISRNGGIRKWQPYSIDKEDDYLKCGRLHLRSGKCCTVAFY